VLSKGIGWNRNRADIARAIDIRKILEISSDYSPVCNMIPSERSGLFPAKAPLNFTQFLRGGMRHWSQMVHMSQTVCNI
ncbi:MAG: hypothetical protein VKJ24_10185, partial [Synechococcales bacterium]|nr:hypothetical protein [Synechococcales bacterium]